MTMGLCDNRKLVHNGHVESGARGIVCRQLNESPTLLLIITTHYWTVPINLCSNSCVNTILKDYASGNLISVGIFLTALLAMRLKS